MGNRPHVFSTMVTADTPESGNNTETVAATLNGVTSEFPNQQVNLSAQATVTVGTTGTGMTIRVRRDSLTGTLVGEANADTGDVAAGKTTTININVDDVRAGEFVGSYVVTFQGTAETAVGTCVYAHLQALVN